MRLGFWHALAPYIFAITVCFLRVLKKGLWSINILWAANDFLHGMFRTTNFIMESVACGRTEPEAKRQEKQLVD